MRGIQRLQRSKLQQHLFSRNLDAQGTTLPILKWRLLVCARWSLLVLRRLAGKRMGDTKRRGNHMWRLYGGNGRHQTLWQSHVAVARGHRDNNISLVVVGVRGASKRGNASTDNHLHTKQNAVSRPGVIKRERKGSSRGNVCQSTCVTGEHLCSTRKCATVVLMDKPPK